MATLQKIRNQAGVLVAVIIGLALLAFILGDMLRSGSSLLRGKQMEIAEIAGKSIDYKEFQQKLDELTEIYKMNSGTNSVDQKMLEQLREQTWQNMVRNYVMSDIYKDLGIGVSSDELFDMVQGNNISPIIQQLFRDPQTGQVNRSAILQFLKHLETNGTSQQKAYWLFMEKQIVSQRKYTKYNDLVAKGLYITTAEAKQDVAHKNHKVDINYVAQTYASVPDSAVPVSDAEMQRYYNNHQKLYQQDATRRIEYVVFPVVPSASDKQSAHKWIENIKSDFANANDDVAFVNVNSDVPFDDSFYKKDELSPELGDFAFSEKVGDIYGPYKDGDSWKLAKIEKFENLPDSVRARHILIRVTSQADAQKAQSLADSLKTVIEKGGNFATLAEKYSQDPGSANNGGDLGWFRRGTMVKAFNDAAFSSKVNEISEVKTQYGIHLLQVTKRGKTAPNVQLAIISRKVEPSSQTYQSVYSIASKFAGENQTQEAFNKAVASEGLDKRYATIKEDQQNIKGLKDARILVRSAFSNSEVGKLIVSYEGTPIFDLGDNFVIAVLTGIQEKGIAPFSAVKDRVELAVRKEQKGNYLAKEMEGKSNLVALAAALNVDEKQARNLTFNSYSIPGAGVEPAVIGTATTLGLHDVSTPVKGNNGVYMVEVTNVKEGADTDVAGDKVQMMMSLSYRANTQAFETLKKEADIVDNRSKFY
ncbi:SurA N-terminal domain-containing protein [Prolixibacter sp. SD074]|uniref:peptidylprolyl isomerase n=1 Tax=Prolixibacter sp. SD074 TaxID=2652391 RepID=UPI001270EEB2|nr:SurA N-terminal domain-containing protein [Prolixibacter sp. SD074]GET30128.1 peptidylprolyl isomerase [Prolixibacter sp. SD074]